MQKQERKIYQHITEKEPGLVRHKGSTKSFSKNLSQLLENVPSMSDKSKDSS